MQAGDQKGPESAQHGSIIERLALETGSEPAHVRDLYERELAQLEATAKVRRFLSVLACRNVRMELREKYADTK